MKEILYKSTRGDGRVVHASEAILRGIASDGGLFMPAEIPSFDFRLADLAGKDYRTHAYEVMKLFLTDFTKEELEDCIEGAYGDHFDTKEIAPLKKTGNAFFLELFHGSTIAFKDMALSILPYLLSTAAAKEGITDKIVILTATSGDTGKAAMAGFQDVPGTAIIVFYPAGGVSRIQELQMLTQKGDNTYVASIEGNFDDAQNGVKRIFGDRDFGRHLKENGIILSSANSINIGRLVPQIVYYVYAYTRLLLQGEIKEGEEINICVPTGNFGNILAAYMAKQMGLPVHKLLCASNENKVLFDFFQSGSYDRNREFILTSSPSMDILISSNLERLIFLAAERDSLRTKELMEALSTTGRYEIDEGMRRFLEDFHGGFSKESEVFEKIRDLYESEGYVIDTHTGVAAHVYDTYRRETGDTRTCVIASTASPYKFSSHVMKALMPDRVFADEWETVDALCKASRVPIPNAVQEVRGAPILHDGRIPVSEMAKFVAKILEV